MFTTGAEGGMFGSGGIFGGQGGGTGGTGGQSSGDATGTGNATGKGASTSAATLYGDTNGLVFDQKTLIVLGISIASLGIAMVGLIFLLRK